MPIRFGPSLSTFSRFLDHAVSGELSILAATAREKKKQFNEAADYSLKTKTIGGYRNKPARSTAAASLYSHPINFFKEHFFSLVERYSCTRLLVSKFVGEALVLVPHSPEPQSGSDTSTMLSATINDVRSGYVRRQL